MQVKSLEERLAALEVAASAAAAEGDGDQATAAPSGPPCPSVRPFPTPAQLPPRPSYLTGVDGVVEALRDAFTATDGSRCVAALHQAVRGVGGIGKTTVAAEYVYRFGMDAEVYPGGVLWLDADTAASLQASLHATVVGALACEHLRGTVDAAALRSALFEWLSATSGWLVVFDNVDDAAVATPFLPPATARGHVLLTSRLDDAGLRPLGIDTPLCMGCLEPPQAQLLLLRCSGLAEAASASAVADLAQRSPSEHEALVELAGPRGLAGLPLALEWAGAYVRNNCTTLKAFLHLYRTVGSYALAPSTATGSSTSSTTTGQQDGTASGSVGGGAAASRSGALKAVEAMLSVCVSGFRLASFRLAALTQSLLVACCRNTSWLRCCHLLSAWALRNSVMCLCWNQTMSTRCYGRSAARHQCHVWQRVASLACKVPLRQRWLLMLMLVQGLVVVERAQRLRLTCRVQAELVAQ